MRPTFLFFFVLILSSSALIGQSTPDYQKIDRDTWKDTVEGINYDEASKEPKPVKNINPSIFNWVPSLGLGKVFMWLVILALVVLIAILIVRQYSKPKNVKIDPKKQVFGLFKEAEELSKSQLESALSEALKAKDYRLAVRIYYLMIIQALSSKKLIRWKMDKTNGDYVRELRGKEHFQDFKDLTLTFDRIWYGGMQVDHVNFQELSPQFQYLLNNISKISKN